MNFTPGEAIEIAANTFVLGLRVLMEVRDSICRPAVKEIRQRDATACNEIEVIGGDYQKARKIH